MEKLVYRTIRRNSEILWCRACSVPELLFRFVPPIRFQKGVFANLVLAGDYTDNTTPDQDHQIRVVLEIRGILLEMYQTPKRLVPN